MTALIAGLALLGAAWMFSTLPFQAPDEAAQYLRALSIANGQLVGPRVPLDAAGQARLRAGGWQARQQDWVDHDRRGVVVPASLSPPGGTCLDGTADLRGTCTEVSYTGDYYPLGYLLPAAGISAAGDWQTASWLARAGSLIPVLFFISLALILAGRSSAWNLIGLLGAITPMVLFIGSVINPSGLEIAANLAFIAALLELWRTRGQLPPWLGRALLLSGVVTIDAWQLGPLFAGLDLLAWAALCGRAQLQTLWRGRRRFMLGAAGVWLAAAAIFFAYGLAAGTLHSHILVHPFLSNLGAGRDQLGPTIRGAVGTFGSLQVNLPAWMIDAWLLAVLALVCLALWAGSLRERLLILAATASGAGFPIAFFAFSLRSSGFGLQGRYVLPLLALTPMLAGAVIGANQERVSALRLTRGWTFCWVGFAAFQLGAWWVNAHFWSAGHGVLLHNPSWSPPPGWTTCLILAGAGAVAVSLSSIGWWSPDRRVVSRRPRG